MIKAILLLLLLILFLASSCESYRVNPHPSDRDILKENDSSSTGERP
jgi:hypothetical protein